ncbi:MAG TPA: hypothetical protein PLN03_13420 [Spirochaetota bacterium]|nr:hypothetical protein [Spirochaetota bacterium]
MTKVTLPNEQYLQKDFVEARIARIMEPELEWMNFLPKVKVDSKAIWASREKYSAESDPAARAPRMRTAGSRFVQVSVSNLEEISTTMTPLGLEIRIDEDAIRFPEGIDMINRAYTRAAYWMAKQINNEIIYALKTGVYKEQSGDRFHDKNTPAWSEDSSRNPIEDLQLLLRDFERDEYPYELTDVYVHKDNFGELLNYLVNLDVAQGERQAVFGMPDFKKQALNIPVLGVNVHKVRGGMDEGSILGVDARFSPATYYYGVNPKYPQTTENNLGFHLNKYVEEETHDTIFQMWCEFAILVKEPYAGIYAVSGI